jgi:hypothetical protein
MIRWIAMPLLSVALMFSLAQCQASDVRFSVGVGTDGYVYYPDGGYTYYHPYTYDDYGYYTPSYNWNTNSNWYIGWYGDSDRDRGYWRGRDWDGGRRGSWDGRGSFDGSRGGFSSRSRHR